MLQVWRGLEEQPREDNWHDAGVWCMYLINVRFREVIKYYFADFVCKGGTPSPPFTDKICKVVFDGLPNVLQVLRCSKF